MNVFQLPKKPVTCAECGNKAHPGDFDYFRGNFWCRACLTEDIETPTLETYSTPRSNFGDVFICETEREKKRKQQWHNLYMKRKKEEQNVRA